MSIIENTVFLMSSVALGNDRPKVIVGFVSFSLSYKIQSTLTLLTTEVESISTPSDDMEDFVR